MKRKCKFKVGKTNCDKEYYSSGYCRSHYLIDFYKNKVKFGKYMVR
ncbi:MAG: hypothetical protein KKB31_00245 [Nanoarchaeota archaeon]|nr:hypothetical protein [Nanoarchaeota archaeon]